jgi:hypothetical protein
VTLILSILNQHEDNTLQRTNYVPCLPRDEYKKLINGFQIGQDENGKPIYDLWMDHYKVTMRCMLSQAGETDVDMRTFATQKCAYQRSGLDNVPLSRPLRGYGFIVFIACLGFLCQDHRYWQIAKVILKSFPLGVAEKFKPLSFVRTLRLNCLTNRYASFGKKFGGRYI